MTGFTLTFRIVLAALAVPIWMIFSTTHLYGNTQLQATDWSHPASMFQPDGAVWSPKLLTDRYGDLHQIWSVEARTDEEADAIFYSTMHNGKWSTPVDVLLGRMIRFLDVGLDANDVLHVVWTDGQLFYSSVSLHGADNAMQWSTPIMLDSDQTEDAALVIGPDGTMYVYYAVLSNLPGIYMARYNDKSNRWEQRQIVSQELSSNQLPSTIDASITPDGSMHVIWSLVPSPNFYPPLGIYYSSMIKGEDRWSLPKPLEEGPSSQPSIIATEDGTLLTVWSTIASIRERHSRWSVDGGTTWSEIAVFAPGLAGLSTWSPLVLDTEGWTYAIVDSDSPQAIFVTTWSRNTGWSEPLNVSQTYGPEIGRIVGTPAVAVLPDQTVVVTYVEQGHGYRYVTAQGRGPTKPPMSIQIPINVASPPAIQEKIRPDSMATPNSLLGPSLQFDRTAPRHSELGTSFTVVIVPVILAVLMGTGMVIIQLSRRRNP